ncbi:Protein P80, protein [Acrodontium crateriforme]|uniref:Copper transport protein n=1 Tax=Acrodontium crateriforme TaxID=150365 RepID=A0AAQ3RB01_9PEZI|nr:Protein P80, protein [Acrodontium crateriforme]
MTSSMAMSMAMSGMSTATSTTAMSMSMSTAASSTMSMSTTITSAMSMATSKVMSMASGTSMSMSMASGTSMSMPMSTSTSDMTMGMQDMLMVFFTSAKTPLYSSSWTPSNKGQYAGTCIFLIVLAAIFRSLLALRCNFPLLQARYFQSKNSGLLKNAAEQNCCTANGLVPPAQRWKINDAVVIACIDTTLAGTSYLLMLAVMTMNVGYFMAVLGGTFLGSFALGQWTGAAAH